MRTKIRAQRPSSEAKPNKKVEPDTDTDSEDSIDVKRDGVISAQEARAATATTETAGGGGRAAHVALVEAALPRGPMPLPPLPPVSSCPSQSFRCLLGKALIGPV